MARTRARGNGEGTVFKLPNGKWRAEVTLGWEKREGKPDKRIVKTKSGFKFKRDAIAALDELKQTVIDIDVDIQFKDLYDKWSNTHFPTVTKDTEYCYTAAYAQCKTLYYKPFTKLKTQDLQAVIEDCNLGRRTKQNIKAMMTCMYKYAIENDYCDKNYATFIKLPPKEASKKDAFTQDERNILWRDYEAGNDFTGYILIMMYTGMRYGELAKILKENINLDKKHMIGGIKTEAGKNRIIPICNKILPIVTKFYHAQDEKLLDMQEKKFYTRYSDTLARLGIRQLPPHSCRHTCATALAEEGVQPAIIQQILGHTDYATTMQYTHVKIDPMLEAVNLIG